MPPGTLPDIWDSSLPLDLYARQGVFEDLWPWIDGDPELGRERVMEHVLDCAALDGKLYQVCGSFIINTAIGMPDVVGDRTSWTIEDLLAAYESLGPDAGILDRYMSSYYLLQSLIGEDLDRYVDWDTGECRFDSTEFKEVLELCAPILDQICPEPPEKGWGPFCYQYISSIMFPNGGFAPEADRCGGGALFYDAEGCYQYKYAGSLCEYQSIYAGYYLSYVVSVLGKIMRVPAMRRRFCFWSRGK